MKSASQSLRRACLASAAAVAVVLTGCGGGGGGGGGDGGPVADTTPPVVISVTPAADATDAALNTAVVVSFSEAVDCATVSASSFTLSAGSGHLSGSIACSGNGATFTPSAGLAASTSHTATVTTAVKDAAGNALAAAKTWSFTTGAAPDTTPPAAVSVTPAPDAANVALDAAVTVSFGEAVDCATVNASSFRLSAGSGPLSGSVACSGNGATFTPSASLAPSTLHTATLTTAVKDAAGNALAAAKTWSFSTGAGPDTTPPTVVAVAPAADARGVALNAAVTVSFSEPVDCATVNGSSFTVVTASGPVNGSIACSRDAATFTPSAGLAPSTSHTATVTTAVKDPAGNAVAAATSWTFTTGAAPDTTPPTMVSASPAAGATSVALDAVVTVSFSEPVDCATVTASTFFLVTGGGRVAGSVACSGSTATFTPAAPLAENARHTASVTATDLAGNLMTSVLWSFTTGAAPDTIPPTVVSVTPAAGATDVALDAVVTVSFSEPVDCTTVTTATLRLETATHTPIAGTVTCSGSAATFQASSPLARVTEHVATVGAGVRDAAGNALGAAYGWRFTTRSRVWGAATRVSDGQGGVDSFQLAVNATGAAVAVWIQTDAANQKHLWWAGFVPGTGWGAPEAAEDLAGDASQPQVAIDAAGDSAVAWTQKDGTGAAVWTRVRAANGTWGGALKLWGDSPSLGVDGNGNVICVWRHDDGTRFNVWASRYPLGTATLSGTWEAAVLIEADDNRSAVSAPSVAVSKDGDAVAVWTFRNGMFGQYVVAANGYGVASGRWGSAVDVTLGSSTAPMDPTVVMNGAGEAVAVWRQEYPSSAGYVTSLSTARWSAGSWGAPAQFPAWVDGLLTRAPSVAANGRGDVEVVWAVSWGACNRPSFRRYDAGTGWGTQGFLPIASCADRPAIALDPDGNATVAWGELTGASDSRIKAARYTAASASWDPAAASLDAQGIGVLPALAADAKGDVLALWLRWNGTRHDLVASRLE